VTDTSPAVPAAASRLHRPRLRLARAVLALGLVAIFGVVVYVAAGIYVYDEVSRVSPLCGDPALQDTPASFGQAADRLEAYRMASYETVQFWSRDPAIAISSWYVTGRDPTGPAVIVVHGLNGCKRRTGVLLAAGMLNRAGFAVLVPDLRDHGESTIEDGRHAGGTEEFRDVLGAWDYLRKRGHPTERIGLYGQSFGAATVMIAAGAEPRVAAVWEDSGYGELDEAIRDELERQGYPEQLAPAGILAARLVSGDDLTSRSPLDATQRLGGRAAFVTHGEADTRLSPAFAEELIRGLRSSGARVESWIVPGSGHVEAIRRETAEYERRLVAFFEAALGRPGE
jgi:hypothetical protein